MSTAVSWAPANLITSLVRSRALATDVVLDIGCGIRPQTLCCPRVHICVEPHWSYIEQLRPRLRRRHRSRFVFLHCTWDAAMKLFPDHSIDTVVALDVIEHFEKADAQLFLAEAERVARGQVIVKTPLGFYPQSYEHSHEPDRWGLDGGDWQTHRSGWFPEDFGDGWDCICCQDFYRCDDLGRPFPEPIGLLWALRTLTSSGRPAPRRASYVPCREPWRDIARRCVPAGLRRMLRLAWNKFGGRKKTSDAARL